LWKLAEILQKTLICKVQFLTSLLTDVSHLTVKQSAQMRFLQKRHVLVASTGDSFPNTFRVSAVGTFRPNSRWQERSAIGGEPDLSRSD
jgi:hypothetical protein